MACGRNPVSCSCGPGPATPWVPQREELQDAPLSIHLRMLGELTPAGVVTCLWAPGVGGWALPQGQVIGGSSPPALPPLCPHVSSGY